VAQALNGAQKETGPQAGPDLKCSSMVLRRAGRPVAQTSVS